MSQKKTQTTLCDIGGGLVIFGMIYGFFWFLIGNFLLLFLSKSFNFRSRLTLFLNFNGLTIFFYLIADRKVAYLTPAWFLCGLFSIILICSLIQFVFPSKFRGVRYCLFFSLVIFIGYQNIFGQLKYSNELYYVVDLRGEHLTERQQKRLLHDLTESNSELQYAAGEMLSRCDYFSSETKMELAKFYSSLSPEGREKSWGIPMDCFPKNSEIQKQIFFSLLNDPNSGLRAQAIQQLEKMTLSADESRNILINGLKDPDHMNKRISVIAIRDLGVNDPETLMSLINTLKTPDNDLKNETICTLMKIAPNDLKVLQALIALSDLEMKNIYPSENERTVRWNLVRAFCNANPENSLAKHGRGKFMKDPDPDISQNAASCFYK